MPIAFPFYMPITISVLALYPDRHPRAGRFRRSLRWRGCIRRGEGQAVDAVGVAAVDGELFAVGGSPEPNRPIVAGRGDHASARRKGDGPDTGPVADLGAYTHLPAQIDLKLKNGMAAYGADRSAKMDFIDYDLVDDFELNEILWRSIKGKDAPLPPAVRRAIIFRSQK